MKVFWRRFLHNFAKYDPHVWDLEAYAPDDRKRRLEKDAGDTADDAHQIHRGRQMRRSGAPEAAAAASRPLAQSVAFLGHIAQPNLCRKPRWRGCHTIDSSIQRGPGSVNQPPACAQIFTYCILGI